MSGIFRGPRRNSESGGLVTYGAKDDIGQVNDTDTLAGTRYWMAPTTATPAGSDAVAGISSAAPFATLTKLLDYTSTGGSLSAPADSGFMCKRGEVFYGTSQFNLFSGSFYGNFLLGVYGTGIRPIIKHDNSVVASIQGATCFVNRAGARYKNLEIDVQGTTACTLTTTGTAWAVGDVITGGTSSKTGVLKYISGTSAQIAITSVTPPIQFTNNETVTAPGGKSGVISAFTGITALLISNQAGHVVENCNIHDSTGNGLTTGGTTNLIVRNNLVERCCSTTNNGAGIDGGSTTNSNPLYEYNTVKDCGASTSTSHNIYLDRLVSATIRYNKCTYSAYYGNHSLVIHGTSTDVDIYCNDFGYGNNGIGVNSGYGSGPGSPTQEIFTRIRIRRNKIHDHGTLAGQTAGGAVTLFSGLVDSDFTNNIAWNNILYGIACYEGNPTSGGNVYATDSVMTNFVSQHNCVVASTSSFSGWNGFTSGPGTTASSTGLVFQNEIYCGKASGAGNILIYKDSTLPNSAITFRNICLWNANATTPSTAKVINWDGVTYNVAEFNTYIAANPGLGIQFTNVIQQDPKLLFSGNEPIGLDLSSPCIGAGYASSVTVDFNGNTRGVVKDIGPWQYS